MCNFVVRLAFTLLIKLIAGQSIGRCLPAEDGRAYLLVCRSLNYNAHINWRVTWKNGSVEYVNTYCSQTSSASSSCNTTSVGRMSASPVDQSGRSIFRINHVTIWDHFAEIDCAIRGDEGGETVSTCQLQVYHKPESPVCEFNKSGDNIVHIQCTTPKVFPGLVCNFAQFETTFKQVVSMPSELNELTTEGTDTGYLRSTCALTVYSLKPGTYQYFPVLQPNITISVRNTSVPVSPLKPIQIFISPRQVFVYRDHLHRLSNECRLAIPQVVFICEARGFSRQPTFELLVDRNHATPLTSIVTETSEGRAYRTIFELSGSTDYYSKTILCLARYQDLLVSRETHFDNMADAGNGEKLTLDAGVAHTLTCHGRNLSDGSNLQITCFRDKKVLFTTKAKGDATEITLQVGLEAATCVCVTEDKTKCFSHETRFRFSGDTRESDNQSVFVIITLAVVIAVLVVIVMVIALLKHWRLCHGKKKPVYSPVSTFTSEILENGGELKSELNDDLTLKVFH